MKAAVERLPEGYARLRRIDLLKNPRELRAVVGLSVALIVVMAAAMALCVPFRQAVALFADRPLALLALAVASLAYIVLHELVHGVCIRHYSGRPAKYGFSWAYAYAGSDFWFAKRPYMVITFAPVVLWGLVFAAAQALVPSAWAWWVYLLQVFNISGAAGDFYTAWVISRQPADAYIRDSGTAMEIFARR